MYLSTCEHNVIFLAYGTKNFEVGPSHGYNSEEHMELALPLMVESHVGRRLTCVDPTLRLAM